MQSISKFFKQVLKALNTKTTTFPQAAFGSLRFSLAQVLWVMLLPVLLLLGSCGGGGGGGGGGGSAPAAELSLSVADDGTAVAVPDSVNPKEAFTLSVKASNTGNAASADGTTLTIYRSTDETLDPKEDGVAVGSSSVPELAAEDTSDTIETTIEIPATLAPGDYHYYACVTNTNICSPAVTVTVAAVPDLHLLAIDAVPSSLVAEESFTLSATITNQGNAEAASGGTLTYYRSTDNTISGKDDDTSIGLPISLEAISTEADFPHAGISVTESVAGSYSYGACVAHDDDGDATNNCSSVVTVVFSAVPLPDHNLQVEGIASPSVDEAGKTFSITVSNSGGADADSTTLKVYRSADNTLVPAGDTQVNTGVTTVPALAAGANSGIISTPITIPATLAVGTYYYYACVDAVTGDSNSANDCSQAVTIIFTVPDLGLDSAVADTDILQRGEIFHFLGHGKTMSAAAAPTTPPLKSTVPQTRPLFQLMILRLAQTWYLNWLLATPFLVSAP